MKTFLHNENNKTYFCDIKVKNCFSYIVSYERIGFYVIQSFIISRLLLTGGICV